MAQASNSWFMPSNEPPFYSEHRDPAGPAPRLRVLEISSRSDAALGKQLSAMRLRDPESGNIVEAVYQAAKCYGGGGPAAVRSNGWDAKKADKVRRNEGPLRGFQHGQRFWGTHTGTAFYDWLWIRAARAAGVGAQNAYDAYSDRFHQPGRSMACQAQAMAMLQGISRAGKMHLVDDPDNFLALTQPKLARTKGNYGPSAEEAFPAPPPGEVRVLVCGSREFTDRGLLEGKLNEVRGRLDGGTMRVVHGDAAGADRMAAAWAERHGIGVDAYPADFEQDGRSAGYRRNERMLKDGDPHVVVAFPQGSARGTNHMMEIAAGAGIPVEEVDVRHGITRTETGELTDLGELARTAAQTRPAGPIARPAPEEAANLTNGSREENGEIRVVIAASGYTKGRTRTVVDKLDELQQRAHPAVLRLAMQTARTTGTVVGTAAVWARARGVHYDEYDARNTTSQSAFRLNHQMLADQQPHLVVAFDGARGVETEHLLNGARYLGIAAEVVDTRGGNRTASGELGTFDAEARFRGQASPNPTWARSHPGRSAAEAAEQLPGRAVDADWAQPGAYDCLPRGLTVKLKDREVHQGIEEGRIVRVDRETRWGNPFHLNDRNDDGERNQRIDQYRSHLARSIDAGRIDPKALAKLAGKQLACHCTPKRCHSEVLAAAAAWARGDRARDTERAQAAARATKAMERFVEPEPGQPAETIEELDIGLGAGAGPAGEANAARSGPDESRPPAEAAPTPGDNPLEKIRRQLEEAGADPDDLRTYDDAVNRHIMAAGYPRESDEQRLQKLREQHPRWTDAEQLAAYRDRLQEGGATDRQLERIDRSIDGLRRQVETDVVNRELSEDRPVTDAMREAQDTLNGPDGAMTIARRIGAKVGVSFTAPDKPPRHRQPPLIPARQRDRDPADDIQEVRVAVCGDLGLQDPNVVRRELNRVRDRLDGAPMRLVTGASRGVDRAASGWAADAGVPCDEYPTDWERDRRRAAYKRNETLLNEIEPHVVIAIAPEGDNKGAAHLCELAGRRGIPVERIEETVLVPERKGDHADLRAISRMPATPRPADPNEPAEQPDDEVAPWSMEGIERRLKAQEAAMRANVEIGTHADAPQPRPEAAAGAAAAAARSGPDPAEHAPAEPAASR